MPRTITREVYSFDELSDAAKDKARDWWRSCEEQDLDFDHVIDDAVKVAKLLGIEINSDQVYWQGFSSQGDGACFEGSYSWPTRTELEFMTTISAEINDPEIIRIARELCDIQHRNACGVSAEMRHSGHYYHSGCMSVDVTCEPHRDNPLGASSYGEDVIQLMRDFADWIYDQLRKEYEWIMSDEQVDESIRCNDYTFNEEGERDG